MTHAPILVLDFDGVLHSEADASDPHFSRMPLLADALRGPLAQVQILISSDWRLYFDLASLRQQFPPDLQARVVGVTPRNEQVHARHWGGWVRRYPRQAEVTAWMHQRFGHLGHPWVALDDHPEWFMPGDARVVAVDGRHALQARQLAQVARILSGQNTNSARSQP